MFARVTQLVLILALQQCVQSFDLYLPVRRKKTDSTNVVFVILSQSEPYHASVAKRLKDNIESQVFEAEQRYPIVLLTHEDFHVSGAWTILPLMEPLYMQYIFGDIRWVMFIEAHTTVRCNKLFDALSKAEVEVDSLWLGYPISDAEPTIIHHFHHMEEMEEEGGFVYPNLACGIAMRMDLIKMIVDNFRSKEVSKTMEFSIDAGYELAQIIYQIGGPLITAEMTFCLVATDNCAVYPVQHHICGSSIPEDSIFFAVKTWNAYHSSRVRVVKKTWGRHVTNLLFYSNVDDPRVPAVKTGVPNVKTGHCAKTMAILRDAVKRVEEKPHIKWIFLADDDTLLGVQRLCEILTCYRGGGEVTVLGERYGYGYTWLQKENGSNGYDYISGGGGTAFSIGAARLLSTCACGTIASPDDMTLGACAVYKHGLALTHSPLFHQARPQDYPREVLTLDRPVSFHRHSSPDPLKVYATWFQHDDLALKKRDEL